MAVLVTGGAGYIGSATVDLLLAEGEQVVVLDNLSRGHRKAVPEGVPFYQGKAGERELVRRIAARHGVNACVHFAALTYVGESVEQPGRYYENNVEQGIALLEALREAGVAHFVFSSTAATYGEPEYSPLDEEHRQWPANPYGWSKFCIERLLESYDRAYGLRYVGLRYFNAAGATERCGEDHEPESHLVPNVLRAALGQIPHLRVFGDSYPTPDGTPVRDYIHVADLGSAHLLALRHLRGGGDSHFVNLGNGQGYSVLEVVETARRVTGQAIELQVEAPRMGDASFLVARADRARQILGWEPAFPELEAIIESAWRWHRAHPQGYGD